jgi:hypothetical protein
MKDSLMSRKQKARLVIFALLGLPLLFLLSDLDDGASRVGALINLPKQILCSPWGPIIRWYAPSSPFGSYALGMVYDFTIQILLPISLNGTLIWCIFILPRDYKRWSPHWLLFCIAGLVSFCFTHNSDEVQVLFERHYGSPWSIYSVKYFDWNYAKVTGTTFRFWPLFLYSSLWSSIFVYTPRLFVPKASRPA